MREFDENRLVQWVERGALLLLVIYLGVHTMPRAWGKLNTDFPNYYVTARLAREGFDTSRVYEWVWLQREKDHRAVDDKVIGLIPITPFSTLAMWPLARLQPLTAKHVWLLVNLAALIPIAWFLRAMTGLNYRRIALIFALSFPLHRNLLYGQFYVVLLLLIVAACWAYLRGHDATAGALIAIAAVCKIFPALLFVFFLQRRAWRALIAGAVAGLAAGAASVAVFGWSLHRTYLHVVLPWTLRGEGLPPYATQSASISSVLHFLFLAEPQWNPHPWHESVVCYALLQPLLPILALAPAILLIRREDDSRERVLLEWSALLTAALVVSTSPASYNFVLMALPVCVLAARLLEDKHYGWLAALLVAYLGIGFPIAPPNRAMGPEVLLYVPRLPLMMALLVAFYMLLWLERGTSGGLSWDWTRSAWAVALAVAAVLGVRSTLLVERAMRQEYAYRVPFARQAFLEGSPERAGAEVSAIALTPSGYTLTGENGAVWADSSEDDELSFASGQERVLVERAVSPKSRIVDVKGGADDVVDNAREPMLSAEGKNVAFVRDDHGRGRLMESEGGTERALSPAALNVYEATFLSEKEYAFSAVEGGRPPQIYLTDGGHVNAPLALGEARYPALSADGRWMAYSRLEDGAWNLWLRDERTGTTQRVGHVPCNQIQPAWEGDSKTLLYATDCGRSLWFTAVARRRVGP